MTTKERILSAAVDVFAERGADGGSMREVARRAGVNVATAYHHFGSKRDMLLAIFRELRLLDFGSDWGLDLAKHPIGERLELIIFGSWMHMDSARAVVKVMLGEALKGDDEVRAVFEEWQLQGDNGLAVNLRLAGLADPDNVAARAWVVRQVIWATYVESLMHDAVDWGELHRRARESAATLLETWA